MNKRIMKPLLVIATSILGLVTVGCNNSNSSSVEVIDKPSSSKVSKPSSESKETKPSSSEKTNLDSKSTYVPGPPSSNSSSGATAQTRVENYEELVYSKNRLENADFSFNFSMTSNASIKAKKYRNNDGPDYLSTDGEYEVIDYNLENVEPGENRNMFNTYLGQLEELRRTARMMVDFALSNISVMDKVVLHGGSQYMLSYDSTKDAIYLLCASTNLNTYSYEIRLYYDNYGREVVELIRNGVNDCIVKYIPDNYYYFAEMQGINSIVAVADKVNGNWQGVSYNLRTDCVFLTKEGTYDLANGIAEAYFLVEKNGEFYTYRDKVMSFLDENDPNSWVGTGTVASKSDYTKMIREYIETNKGTIDYDNSGEMRDIYFFASLFDGIEKLHVVLDDRYDRHDGKFIQYHLSDVNDYIQFKNGKKLSTYDIWYEGFGIVHLDRETGSYKNDNGEEVNWNSLRNVPSVRLSSAEGYFDVNEGKYSPENPYRFDIYGETFEEKINTFKKFMEYCGITTKAHYGNDPLGDLVSIESESTLYRNDLYNHLYGLDYSGNVFVEKFFTQYHELEEVHGLVARLLSQYETINFEDLPKIEERLPLSSIGFENDAITLGENKDIDMTSFSATVNKSVIFEEGGKYTIALQINNTSYVTGAFNEVIYNMENMSFTGLVVDLAENPLFTTAGTYSIKAVLVKVLGEDAGYVPLSNSISLKFNEFEPIEKEVGKENMENVGGYYKYVSSANEDGLIVTTKSFVDTAPPVIQGPESLTLLSNNNVSEILGSYKYTDNISKEFTVKIMKGDVEVENAEDTTIEETTYTIVVFDEAGNSSSRNVEIHLIQVVERGLSDDEINELLNIQNGYIVADNYKTSKDRNEHEHMEANYENGICSYKDNSGYVYIRPINNETELEYVTVNENGAYVYHFKLEKDDKTSTFVIEILDGKVVSYTYSATTDFYIENSRATFSYPAEEPEKDPEAENPGEDKKEEDNKSEEGEKIPEEKTDEKNPQESENASEEKKEESVENKVEENQSQENDNSNEKKED